MTDSTKNILFELLRGGLYDKGMLSLSHCPNAEEWQQLFKLSARQGVLAIIYDALKKLPEECAPPKDLLLRWAVTTDHIERDYAHKLETIESLSMFYSENGIPMMVLKGLGVASYYPVPDHRPSSDIDIWLYGRQEQADKAMCDELGVKINKELHHHTVFVFNRETVENHFEFVNQQSHPSNRALERELRRFAAEPGELLRAAEQIVHLPSPNLNALFLMRHLAMHFAATEVGLRYFTDWAMFLQCEGKKVDWDTIRAIYKAQNMDRLADAVTAICVEKLGAAREMAYDYQSDPKLEQTILSETLHPAFDEKPPKSGFVRTVRFKARRWWANRWKHHLVYRDSLLVSFLWLCWSHLAHPKTILKF